MTATYEHPWRSGNWEREIYPMPSFPMLSVADLERSRRWYLDLGFADVFTGRGHDGAPFMVHVRWCAFADLLLTPAPGAPTAPRGGGIRLCFASTSADEVAARAAEIGASVLEPPADRPWNARDVTIADPDGYRLTFTAPTAAMIERIRSGAIPRFDEVIARMKGRVGPAGG